MICDDGRAEWKDNKWARLLAYVTGLVNQKLLLQNEYLIAENRILRSHLPQRLKLSDPQRSTLAEVGKRLGRKALADVAVVAKPETILAWYRRLIAQKFDGSRFRKAPGRPPLSREVVELVLVRTFRLKDDRAMPQFVLIDELFKGRHFDREIVILCVRWYLSFKLSYRDLVTMMGERGIGMAHTTILRWVQHYSPEFEKRWKRYARSVGGSWRMDETYIRVKGDWMYLYRAVDKIGKTVDFFLSRNRDVNAAKAFLRKAMKQQRTPVKITLDAYAASHRAVADLKDSGQLPKRVRVRTSKYLNNLIEQDHRRVKQRLRPMLGLKSFKTAAVVIGGIELMEKIKKGQFKIGKLGGSRATVTEIWEAALAA